MSYTYRRIHVSVHCGKTWLYLLKPIINAVWVYNYYIQTYSAHLYRWQNNRCVIMKIKLMFDWTMHRELNTFLYIKHQENKQINFILFSKTYAYLWTLGISRFRGISKNFLWYKPYPENYDHGCKKISQVGRTVLKW